MHSLDINAEALGQKSSELQNLELLEKKVEIQKKRAEMRKDRASILNEDQRVLKDKVGELRYLLGDFSIDPERTVFAGEPFWVPLLSGKEREQVLKKLMELIDRM